LPAFPSPAADPHGESRERDPGENGAKILHVVEGRFARTAELAPSFEEGCEESAVGYTRPAQVRQNSGGKSRAAGILPYLCWSRVTYGGFFATFFEGWGQFGGPRESPFYYVKNFGTIFSWITLAGLAMWIGRWAWEGRK